LAAYIQAGRPDIQLGPTGSFQDWSDLVRSAIVWAGEADPWATVIARRYSSDTESTEHLTLVAAWDALDADCRGLTVATAKRLYDAVQESAKKTRSMIEGARDRAEYSAVDELIAEGGLKGFDAKRIGYMLRRHKDRPTPDGRRILSRPGHGGAMVWRVAASTVGQTTGEDGVNGEDVSPNNAYGVKKSNVSNPSDPQPGSSPPSAPSSPSKLIREDISAIMK